MNTKKTCFIVFAATFPWLVSAQVLDRHVISSAGDYKSTGISVSYTVGESIITTLLGTEIVTQGFQQPTDEKSMAINDPLFPSLFINTYPNPVKEDLIVAISAPSATELALSIFDIDGRLVFVPVSLTCTSGSSTHHLDLSLLAAGSYCLLVTNTQNGWHQTIKIQKK